MPKLEILNSGRRKLAAFFFVMPFILMGPHFYWCMNMAGTWFVSTRLEPEHLAMTLHLMFFADFWAMAAISWFIALLLLRIDGYRTRLTGLLLLPTGLAAVCALIWFAIGIECFFKYR